MKNIELAEYHPSQGRLYPTLVLQMSFLFEIIQ